MPVAVITGASSGIGYATAVLLRENGYDVVLHARRNLKGLQAAARHMRTPSGLTPSALCVTADLADPLACVDLVTTSFNWRNHIDLWFNNAGADVLASHARQMPFEDRLKQLIDVDVCGTIRISRMVAARMERAAKGGSLPTIINMSWDQADLGMEGDAGQLFCTVKSAVASYSKSLAMSVQNVRVNCVAPGWIQTDWGSNTADEKWSRRAVGESLLNRWGQPEDVARAVLWLASEKSQFVNGQVLAINGGRRYFPHTP